MKVIEYKGRIVFKKMSMPHFQRMMRQYYENEACFAFVTQGEYQIRGQTEYFSINPKQGVLGKCTNYFYEDASYDVAQEGEVIGIYFYPEIYQSLFDFDFSRSTHTTRYNLKQVELDKLLEYFRDSINVLLDSPELADDVLIETKLKEFVSLMTKKVSAPSEMDFIASMFKPHFAQFEEVIQHNLYADLTLDELAKLCHMSLSTFKRKFNSIYSEPPKKYITRLKVQKAVELLKQTDMRVSDVVFQTGFESVSSFNRAFKNVLGRTPSEYRRGDL